MAGVRVRVTMSFDLEVHEIDTLAEFAWSVYEPQKPSNMPAEAAARFRRDLHERPELAVGVLLPTAETLADSWPGVHVTSSNDTVDRLA